MYQEFLQIKKKKKDNPIKNGQKTLLDTSQTSYPKYSVNYNKMFNIMNHQENVN